MFSKNKINKVSKTYFVISFATLILLLLLNYKPFKVSASGGSPLSGVKNVPQNYPPVAQKYFQNYDNYPNPTCSSSTNPAELGWISVDQATKTMNSYQNDTLTVNSGSIQSVPLMISFSDLFCHTSTNNNAYYVTNNPKDGPINSAAVETEINVIGIKSSIPGSFSGLPLPYNLPLALSQATKYWMISYPFKFTPSSPISSNFTITMEDVAINYFHNLSLGNAYCVNGGQQVTGSYPDYNCSSNSWSVVIKVTVKPPICTSNCCQSNCQVADCPEFPNYSNVVVSMPYTGPDSSAHSSNTQQSASSPPPSVYKQDTPQGVKMTSVSDISQGGSRIIPSLVSENDGSPSTPSSASGSVTLNYRPYVLSYPYDYNQPQVNYNNKYTEVLWTPKLTNYSCNGNDRRNGTQCTGTGTQLKSSSTNTKGRCASATPPDTLTQYTFSGITYCFYYGPYTYTYTATANYSWTPGSSQNLESSSTPVPGTQMTPCYDRTFSLLSLPPTTGPGSGSVASLDLNGSVDYEYPNTAQLELPIQYQFGIPPSDPTPNAGFRKPTQLSGVSVNTTADKYHQYNNNYQLTNTLIQPGFCNKTQNPSAFTDNGSGRSSIQYVNFSCPITTSDSSLSDFVAGDNVYFNGSINYYQGNLHETSASGSFSVVNPPTGTSFGTYKTNKVITKPYIQIKGGDAVVGLDQTGNCLNTNSISAWTQNSPSYNGSGTTLAVITGGLDYGFTSAQGTNNAPSGLVFSNTYIPSGSFGGGFCNSSGSGVLPATYAYQQLKNQYPSLTQPQSSSCPTSGQITTTVVCNYGSNTLNLGSLTIGSQGHLIYFGTGPVNINNNILYNLPGTGTTVSDPLTLPSFEVVSSGNNIRIANTVNQIDGSLLTDKSIEDCYISGSVPTTNNIFWDIRNRNLASNQTCNQQLIINGTAEADTIYFDRTYDSLYESSSPDTDSGADGVAPNNSNSAAAEIINYSPLVWLTPNNIQSSSQSQNTPVVQSITSLAPIISH